MFTLIAHRCGPTFFPEQTVASARLAREQGADLVEMDLMYTLDNEPVICHDINTERIFGVNREVQELMLTEFLALRHVVDPSYCAHSLKHMLDATDFPLLLHMRLPQTQIAQDRLFHVLEQDDAYLRVVPGVTFPQEVAVMKAHFPGIRVLTFMPTPDYLGEFLKTGADIIRLWDADVTKDRLKQIHDAGKQAVVMVGQMTPEGVGYTAVERLLELREMGFDGALVNDIPWAVQALSVV